MGYPDAVADNVVVAYPGDGVDSADAGYPGNEADNADAPYPDAVADTVDKVDERSYPEDVVPCHVGTVSYRAEWCHAGTGSCHVVSYHAECCP